MKFLQYIYILTGGIFRKRFMKGKFFLSKIFLLLIHIINFNTKYKEITFEYFPGNIFIQCLLLLNVLFLGISKLDVDI